MPNWKSIKRIDELEERTYYFISFKDGRQGFRVTEEILTLSTFDEITMFKKVIFPDSPTPEDLKNDERDFELETWREISKIHKDIIKEMSKECKDNQNLCLWDNRIKHLESLI